MTPRTFCSSALDRIVRSLILTLVFAGSGLASAAQADPRVLWTHPAADAEHEHRMIAAPVIDDGTLYLAAGSEVRALDLDGRLRWRRDLGAAVAAAVAVAGDVLYAHSDAGLHALDRSGTVLWTHEQRDRGPLVDGRSWGWGAEILADPWGWYRSTPAVDEDSVYFGTSEGLHALDRTDGTARWSLPVGPVTADPVVYEDLLVVASWNHSVYGIERATGEVRWRFRGDDLPGRVLDWIGYEGFHVTPEVADGRVYVGNRNTWFYVLDARTGQRLWGSKVGASWIGSPALVHGEQVFYALSDGHAVFGHDQRGRQTLFYATGATVFARPGLHEDRLLIGALTGHLFAVDSATGEGRELLHLGPEEKRYEEYFDPAIVPEGLSPHQATVWAIDRWLTDSNGIMNLLVHEGVAYLATASGTLYAVALR